MNVLWLVLGGIFTAVEYVVASLLLMVTIVGIPFGMQTLKLAGLALWPFGKEVRTGVRSGGCLYVLMNVLWILLGGIWIALSHLVFGAILCITVIGIPFGLQHFKLAALALTPFGKDIRGEPLYPRFGTIGSTGWIRWFHWADTTVPPSGYDGSRLWKKLEPLFFSVTISYEKSYSSVR